MKLRLKNFRCYENREFDFGEKGLTLLHGSSGVGKSTLLMAIDFALFGNGTKVVSHGKKSCCVELEIDDMKIVRKKGPNHLIVNDSYEDDAGENIIKERFGNSISYIPQNIRKAFVLMSPSERLDFLESFAFSGTDIAAIKARSKSIIRETSDNHIKTLGNLEFASKILEETPKPQEIPFPIKCAKASRERCIKNEEIRYKNTLILIRRSEKEIELLQAEMNSIDILNAVLDEKKMNVSELSEKIISLEEKISNLHYSGDENLSNLRKELEYFVKKKDYFLLQDRYTENTKRLEELKKKEQEEHEKIKERLWSSIPKDEIEEQIQLWRDLKVKKTEYDRIEKEMKSLKVDEKDYTEELRNLNTQIKTQEELILKLKLQKQIMKCPHCEHKLRVSQNTLILHSENEQISGDVPEMIKELEKRKTEEVKLQSHITCNKVKKERVESLQKELDILLEEIGEDKDADIITNLKELETYKSENILLESQLKFSNTIVSLEQNNSSDKRKLDSIVLENNFNSNLDETELRKKITDETLLLEQIKSLKQRILESQRQKEKIETEINTLNNTHIKKYTKVNSVEEIISLKNAKNDIIVENQKKRDEIQIILQQIEKYKEYEKTLESWQNIYKKKTFLETQEIEERKRHAAACLFRDKILEAESIAIQNMIDNINTHVQLYLEYFFPDNPINVRINAFKETKKEESKPSINLEIDYKGIEHDLTMLSGGELSRIILAFTLALAEIHNCPLIMLDECTSSLDQDLTSSVISGLKENFGEKLVILIAHQVVQGVFDKTIKLS